MNGEKRSGGFGNGGELFPVRGGLRWLAAASVASVCGVVVRSVYVGHPSFLFLFWNLLLAAFPLLFALLAARNAGKGNRRGRVIAWGALWLLFFPNAPYIITDFVHLGSWGESPLWLDAVVIGSFAWTGLLLGFESLALLQGIVRKKYGHGIGWGFATAVLVVSSYGIYLGRFQRWNSWDLFTQPAALFADIFSSIAHPSATAQGLALTVGMGVFLLLSYCSVITLREKKMGGGAGIANPGKEMIQNTSTNTEH